jgi:hypothetical protein
VARGKSIIPRVSKLTSESPPVTNISEYIPLEGGSRLLMRRGIGMEIGED